MGGGEMALQLEALAAPLEKLGSVPSTHKAGHDYLELEFQGICTYMHAKYPCMQNIHT